MPLALTGEETGGPDRGEHLAGAVIGHQQGDRDPRVDGRRPIRRQGLQPALQVGIQGQPMDPATGIGLDQAGPQVGGEHGKVVAGVRDRLPTGGRGGRGVDQAQGLGAPQHPVPRPAGGGGVAIGPARLRGLGECDQEGRLGIAQVPGLLAEPGQGPGAQPLQVAAIGGDREIGLEDLRLVRHPLQGQGAQGLPDLPARRAGLATLQQADELHGQGGAAGDDMAAPQELGRGPYQGQGIDPRVRMEALILHREQESNEVRVDGLEVEGQAPAPAGHGEGAQETPLAVEDQGGGGDLKVRRRGGIHQSGQPQPGGQGDRATTDHDQDQPAGKALTGRLREASANGR